MCECDLVLSLISWHSYIYYVQPIVLWLMTNSNDHVSEPSCVCSF
jgi:hypothetical protein